MFVLYTSISFVFFFCATFTFCKYFANNCLISVVIAKLWLQTEFYKTANSRWLARHRKSAFRPNWSFKRVRPLLYTLSVPEIVALTSTWVDLSTGLPPESTDGLRVVCAGARRLHHKHSAYTQISEPGQRRHFGTYLHKIMHWPFFRRLLVACCRVGKKRTEPSGWTRMCCCP